jgi:glutaconyl-CoA decarboxylase
LTTELGRTYTLRIDGKDYVVEVLEVATNKFRVRVGGKELTVELVPKQVPTQQTPEVIVKPGAKVEEAVTPATITGGEVITAPVPGKVVKVLVKPGDRVDEKGVVLTLESMKMELEITSTCSGVVKEVRVKPGDSVNTGDVLVVISRS